VGCPFAWDKKDKKATKTANKIFDDFCKELEK